ncbi:MAG TPA: SRPBCC domain-containing protein [Mycobacterium sp.]|jgi:hypothetical protein|uniref:SRPBCC domain-containing protein n=1 Tax=Mycobacterium sp. TaxID=1785 RepID=UPI002D42A8E4|nr:SRPBCC domain-containing protein [Mycobacterium sp.]HZS22135.1 SRPBCC domain-containing protein [Pseudonocardiaceae bacterium]HZU48678.1 SRPBCC domain-containing protein [Mycobacterium sp.]
MTAESTKEVEVHRSVSVPLSPERAFDLFTARMTEFWPKEHSIGSSAIAQVVIEPRVGGRWYERGVDGTECDWGRVGQWQPPNKVVLLWQIGGDQAGTMYAVFDSPEGWAGTLTRFTEAAG